MVGSEVVVRWCFVVGMWAVATGCREYQDPLAFDECQPYMLECGSCVVDDDLADTQGLRRHYRCETDDGTLYDVVLRDGQVSGAADDVHYYHPDSGYRLAAERRYEQAVEVCEVDMKVEWYGEILEDCVATCELDPALPDADPDLSSC